MRIGRKRKGSNAINLKAKIDKKKMKERLMMSAHHFTHDKPIARCSLTRNTILLILMGLSGLWILTGNLGPFHQSSFGETCSTCLTLASSMHSKSAQMRGMAKTVPLLVATWNLVLNSMASRTGLGISVTRVTFSRSGLMRTQQIILIIAMETALELQAESGAPISQQCSATTPLSEELWSSTNIQTTSMSPSKVEERLPVAKLSATAKLAKQGAERKQS